MKEIKIDNIKDKLLNIDRGSLMKKIKKVTIIALSSIIILGGIGVYAGYSYIQSNEKYTQVDCEKIALGKIPGEIIKSEKGINKETLSLTYEFKIKGKDNLLNEIEVDSKSGAIIDIDNVDFKDSHKDRFERD